MQYERYNIKNTKLYENVILKNLKQQKTTKYNKIQKNEKEYITIRYHL